MATSPSLTRRQFVRCALSVGGVALAGPQFLGKSARAAASESSPWQIGIYTRPWGAHDYRVALDAMAEAGYKYAGLMTAKAKGNLVISVETTLEESAQIGQEVKKRGLKLVSIYGGGIPVNQSLQAGIDGMRKLIDNCVAAGASSLLMGGTSNAKIVENESTDRNLVGHNLVSFSAESLDYG